MSKIKFGGGHRKCEKCGNTIFGSKFHICSDKEIKLDTDKLLYHLIWVLEQYCGYMIEDDNNPRSTRYNADARAVMFLAENGYAEIIGDKKFPETKFMDFVWTNKGWGILNDNK